MLGVSFRKNYKVKYKGATTMYRKFSFWLAEDTAKLEEFKRALTKPEDIAVFDKCLEIIRRKKAYSCSKEDFIKHCLDKGIRKDRIEYAWDLIRGELTSTQLAGKYCVEIETIHQDRWRFRTKLDKE